MISYYFVVAASNGIRTGENAAQKIANTHGSGTSLDGRCVAERLSHGAPIARSSAHQAFSGVQLRTYYYPYSRKKRLCEAREERQRPHLSALDWQKRSHTV